MVWVRSFAAFFSDKYLCLSCVNILTFPIWYYAVLPPTSVWEVGGRMKKLYFMTKIKPFPTYIGFPLLPDIVDHIVQLVQLLLRVVRFGVDRDQNQIFHDWNRYRYE